MLCKCHGLPMKPNVSRGNPYWSCRVPIRERQKAAARLMRDSREYRVKQRLGRLRLMRGRVLEQLAHLQEGDCGAES